MKEPCDAAWITYGYRTGRDVFCHYTSGSDHAVVTYGTLGSTVTDAPIHTLLPTVIGRAYSRPLFLSTGSIG